MEVSLLIVEANIKMSLTNYTSTKDHQVCGNRNKQAIRLELEAIENSETLEQRTKKKGRKKDKTCVLANCETRKYKADDWTIQNEAKGRG